MSGFHPYKQGESSKASSPVSPSDSGSLIPQPPQNSKASKRIRGEIACAECRRLKIRCDKTVPCSTCLKRGCASLCPNGTIPPGQGSRFVLAATDHLHRKLAKLEARMHSLEDALAIAQADHSNELHPLLVEYGDEEEDPYPKYTLKEEEGEDTPITDRLGTLYIGKGGINRFYGPSGSSESILLDQKSYEERTQADSPAPRLPELDYSCLPPEIVRFSQAFPMAPPYLPKRVTQASIESFLPPIERAITLCETFLEHLSWMFHVVSKQQLISELIPAIYKQSDYSYGPHELSLLLIVLGIGALVDLSLEPYSLEAQYYYMLARASAVLQPVLTEQSVVTIKVLHLMSVYNGMSGKESNLEHSYSLLNLAGQVALKIGFHLDPSMWKFEGREAYDRRVYFWNLLAGTLWQCLVTGRPPVIFSNHIDCKIPTSAEESLYQQGEVPLGFGTWGFRATTECLLPVVEATLSAKSPSYETVMEIDAKIRQFATPPPYDGEPVNDRTALSMRTFVRSHYQDLMLLYLHRGFFTHAMSEYPANPLLSPYRKSVIAAYQSACTVLDFTRTQFQKKPLLCARIWRIWSFAFSAAVIVGTVATRGFHLNLEPPALGQFESACTVFRDAAKISIRAAKVLPVLQAMLQKAIEAQEAQRKQLLVSLAGDGLPVLPEHPVMTKQKVPSSLMNDSTDHNTFASLSESHAFAPPPRVPAPSMKRPAFFGLDAPLNPYDTSMPISTTSHASQSSSYRAPQLPSLTLPSLPPQPPPPSASSSSHQVEAQTFADLSRGWGGLFHETTGSMDMYTGYGQQSGASVSGEKRNSAGGGYGDNMMLNDRWSSFMNYNILESRRGSAPSSNSNTNRLPSHLPP